MKLFVKLILDIFDKQTEKKINFYLKKIFIDTIPVVIDVGSHKGEYIDNILNNFETKKIYSFEPNPKILKILRKKFYNFQKVEIFDYGLGEIKRGEILNDNLESSSTSINMLNKDSKYFKKKYFFLNPLKYKKISVPIKIEVITLEDFFNEQKIKIVDLLKIDTEGYEFKVLKGLGKHIAKVRFIHFEHHFDDMIIKNYNLSEIHDLLRNNNFEKVFKVKMKFRKSFEYIYENKTL